MRPSAWSRLRGSEYGKTRVKKGWNEEKEEGVKGRIIRKIRLKGGETGRQKRGDGGDRSRGREAE